MGQARIPSGLECAMRNLATTSGATWKRNSTDAGGTSEARCRERYRVRDQNRGLICMALVADSVLECNLNNSTPRPSARSAKNWSKTLPATINLVTTRRGKGSIRTAGSGRLMSSANQPGHLPRLGRTWALGQGQRLKLRPSGRPSKVLCTPANDAAAPFDRFGPDQAGTAPHKVSLG
jgi:hypothetical protein